MHRSLHILEIVESICTHLGSQNFYYLPQDDAKALAALAATCQALHGPALDALWHYQGSLAPILKCMPADVWSDPPSKSNLDSITTCRAITAADWERPMEYLHRIKNFVCSDGADLFGILRRSFPGDIFCPNVRILAWCPDPMDAFPHIIFLLGPHIQELTIRTDLTPFHLSLLPHLGPQYPFLRRAAVLLDEEPHELALPYIAPFICNLTRLKDVSFTNIDSESFNHLGQLPDLETIVLVTPGGFTPRSSSSADSPLFVALQVLQIESATPAFIAAFLRCMTKAPLRSLSATFSALPEAAYLEDVYSALPGHCSHSSPSYIDISYNWHDPPVHDPQSNHRHIVTGPTLRHLFCFRNLTTICLEPPMGFDIDDAVVVDMARAWPVIEDLQLMSPAYHPQDPVPRVTLNVLPAFARHCPCLASVRLVLDASVVPDVTHNCSPQKTLTSLDVGYSAIVSAPPVASYVSSLFPELTHLFTDHDGERYPGPHGLNLTYSDSFHKIWKEAERLLPARTRDEDEEDDNYGEEDNEDADDD
ncbi:hypothetical protein C8R47DRAFT_721573 [Mycena vitilis]|nr:hypothetical protein C8R47DRAFT_721573 [Mycena vitilis]